MGRNFRFWKTRSLQQPKKVVMEHRKEGTPYSTMSSMHVFQLWSPEDDVISRSRWKEVVNHVYAGVGGGTHIGQAYWAKTRVWKEPDLDKVQKVEGWEKKAGHHRKEDTPCSTMANMSVFQR